MDDSLLTVDEVAKRLKLKVSRVYVHADTLGAFRVGKYLRFSWDRVVERLARDQVSSMGSQPNDQT
jgi:excisionase family DNA binding protein